MPLDLGPVNVTPTILDDFGPVTQAVGDVIDLGVLAAVAHPIADQIETITGALDLGPILSPITLERRLRRDHRPADPHPCAWDRSMSEQLQLRRGTAAQIAANTPAAGEVWVDTDHNRLASATGRRSAASPLRR